MAETIEEAEIVENDDKTTTDIGGSEKNADIDLGLDDLDIEVEFESNDYSKKLAQASTGTSSAPPVDDDEDDDDATDSNTKTTENANGEDEPEWSEEDLKVGAEFAIEFLDAISANACKAIAQEEDPAQFELTIGQKGRLTTILVKVFQKHQVKMGPMSALILAIIMYFGLNFKDAYSIRMKKKTEEEKKIKQANFQKRKVQQQKLQTTMISKLGESELTLSELSQKMKMKETAVRKYLKSLAEQDLIVINDTTVPNKYKVAA